MNKEREVQGDGEEGKDEEEVCVCGGGAGVVCF